MFINLEKEPSSYRTRSFTKAAARETGGTFRTDAREGAEEKGQKGKEGEAFETSGSG